MSLVRAATLEVVLGCLGAGCFSHGSEPLGRAVLLAERGHEAEAIQLLRTHLVDHPDAIDERRMLIRVLGSTGDLNQTRVEVTRLAQRLGPESPIPWLELGHALELNHDYEQALQSYDHAAAVATKDPAGPLTGGLRAARWGEVELAVPRLEEALRRDPSNPVAWHALGLSRFTMEDRSGARDAYASGLKADPSYQPNRLGLATLSVALGHYKSALFHYDALIQLRPTFADAYLGRSLALLQLGCLDEAEGALAEGYRLGANRKVVAKQRRLLAKLRASQSASSRPP